MLHIVKTDQALTEACRVFSQQDEMVLIEQAVYAANPQHHAFPLLQGRKVAVLQSDTEARGIVNRISSNFAIIDYSGWVDLTAAHASSITWE